MRAFLILLGTFMLALVAGALVYFNFGGEKVNASSKAYVDENVPIIIGSWSQAELEKRASRELLRVAHNNVATVNKVMEVCSKLGAMRSYDGSTGEAKINYLLVMTGLGATATYTAHATCENGRAVIRVGLVQEGGAWKILTFRVDSPYFHSHAIPAVRASSHGSNY